ncbi:MAG: ABC transporter permease [Anaerolineae bacterium]|nr:ABC transporter permease [Anaerolineae bacterium]
MSIRRAAAIARKEFRHILRDLRTFFLVTISPAFLLLLLSYIFAFDVENVDIALWDLDESVLSRQYVSALTADGDFRVYERVTSYAALDDLILSGRVTGALIIPPGFDAGLRAGQAVQVQAIVDGSDPIATRQAGYSLEQRTAAFAAACETCRSPSGGLELITDARYNPTLKSLISMVPGLMAIVLCMPALALALALAREKETGSFESLITTPVRGIEYLVGKTVAYVINGLGSVFLAWAVATLYFEVPFRGSLVGYMALSSLYLVASMGFSLFIANFVKNQQTAMFLVLMVFFVPSFFITGLIAPVDAKSIFSQLISYALPTTHFIVISRGVFLKGLEAAALAFPALILAGMGAGGLAVSLALFHKRVG